MKYSFICIIVLALATLEGYGSSTPLTDLGPGKVLVALLPNSQGGVGYLSSNGKVPAVFDTQGNATVLLLAQGMRGGALTGATLGGSYGGVLESSQGDYYAAYWPTITSSPQVIGPKNSVATAIAEKQGSIVGIAIQDSTPHAFLYDPTTNTFQILKTRGLDSSSSKAWGVDASGQTIVGEGDINGTIWGLYWTTPNTVAEYGITSQRLRGVSYTGSVAVGQHQGASGSTYGTTAAVWSRASYGFGNPDLLVLADPAPIHELKFKKMSRDGHFAVGSLVPTNNTCTSIGAIYDVLSKSLYRIDDFVKLKGFDMGQEIPTNIVDGGFDGSFVAVKLTSGNSAFLDLRAQKGPKGDAGEKGSQGETGAKGPAGTSGSTSLKPPLFGDTIRRWRRGNTNTTVLPISSLYPRGKRVIQKG